jgi:alkanesulfonate monooxygenase SsuD/methylene tetrahydromethanopterin reductase-like flavin-dependent oxidoreductase (luciferase family)
MSSGQIDPAAAADLTTASIEAKIERVRTAAADAGRPTPRLQFNCFYVHVTDGLGPGPQSSWAGAVEANMDLLKGSPVVLVGTAAQCAQQLLEWHERFGITDWHLGPDVDATSRILECLSPNGYS